MHLILFFIVLSVCHISFCGAFYHPGLFFFLITYLRENCDKQIFKFKCFYSERKFT